MNCNLKQYEAIKIVLKPLAYMTKHGVPVCQCAADVEQLSITASEAYNTDIDVKSLVNNIASIICGIIEKHGE